MDEWGLRRGGRRRWRVYRPGAGHPVAEVGLLHTGEWWVCLTGEAVPWRQTYPTRAAAVAAVRRWCAR